jgi:hypothetical protein
LFFTGVMVQIFLMQAFGMRTSLAQTFLLRSCLMRTLRVQSLTMLISRAPYSIPQLRGTGNFLLSHGIGDSVCPFLDSRLRENDGFGRIQLRVDSRGQAPKIPDMVP